MEPGTPDLLVAVFAVVLGAVIGSFLNVVIARVPAGESIVAPGSRCPRCGAPIRWYDNVPVLSWVLLRARCRSCRAPISARYPLVEALVAALALVAFRRHGLGAAAAAELVLVALLVALAFIDLDTWLLPHALTWPLIALGLGASALGLTAAGSLRSAALGAGIGFGAFAALSLGARLALKKDALGFGDVWLLAGIGAWLGPAALLPVVMLASIQGSVVGIVLLLAGKGEPGPSEDGARAETQPPAAAPATRADDDWVPPRHSVPFGPFLAAGALEWLFLAGPLAALVPALELFR